MAEIVNVLVVSARVEAGNVRAFIEWVKARPGAVRYGSSGTGQPDHLAGELFQRAAGLRMIHVPYKGGGPALVDLIAGDLDLMFATYTVALPHVKAGRIRALAVSTPERQVLLPDLPAISETLPGFGLSNWNGLFAPGRTPSAIADRLFAEVAKALQSSELRRRLAAAGIEPAGSESRAAFARFVRKETAHWGQIVRDAAIVAD